jgi:hypothetical protein
MAHYRKGAKVTVRIDGVDHEAEIEKVVPRPKGAGAVRNPYLPHGGMQTYVVFLPKANGGIGQVREVLETQVKPARDLSLRTFEDGQRVRLGDTEYTVVGLNRVRDDGTNEYTLQADGFEDADPRDFPWERGVKVAGAGALEPVLSMPDIIPDDIMNAPRPELSDEPADLGPWQQLDDDGPSL